MSEVHDCSVGDDLKFFQQISHLESAVRKLQEEVRLMEDALTSYVRADELRRKWGANGEIVVKAFAQARQQALIAWGVIDEVDSEDDSEL